MTFFVLICASIVVAVVAALVMTARYDAKGNRRFLVMFRRDLPPETELKGEPLVFETRKSLFYVTAYLLLLAPGMGVALTFYSRVVYENLFVAICVLGLIVMAAALFLLLVDQYFVRLYVYQNGIVRRGLLRTQTYFYYQLESFRLGRTYTRRGVSYAMYTFSTDCKAVVRLPVPVYRNITFLEQVFTEANPYVRTCFKEEADSKVKYRIF